MGDYDCSYRKSDVGPLVLLVLEEVNFAGLLEERLQSEEFLLRLKRLIFRLGL